MPYSTPFFYPAQTTTVRKPKATSGILAGWYIYNPNSVVAYVQFFDTADTVTLGTTVPKNSFGIPATSAANSPCAATYAKGIQLACATTATGSTAPDTGLEVNVFVE
jgi:hypothetical protein